MVNRRTNQRFIGKNPRLKSAEEYLLLSLQRERLRCGIEQPIATDLRLVLYFFFSPDDYYLRDPKTKLLRRKKTVPDTLGLGEIIQDCMQDAGIIENDSQIADVRCIRLCGERTEVRIELYDIKDEPLQLAL